MSDLTMTSLASAYPHLEAMSREAVAKGITTGPLLGAGGYGLVFQADTSRDGPCALKVPWVGPPSWEAHQPQPGLVPGAAAAPIQISLATVTGPFYERHLETLEEACVLLRETLRHQSLYLHIPPMVPLVHSWELAGFPAGLFPRAAGQSLRKLMMENPREARRALPYIAAALEQLHSNGGVQRDLKPDHIFVDGESVTFIDPLPEGAWFGTRGYALPWSQVMGFPRTSWEEVRLLNGCPFADVAGLAATVAEVWGGTVGWEHFLADRMANIGNGRFGGVGPFQHWPEPVVMIMEQTRAGLAPVPASLREWVEGAVEAIAQAHYADSTQASQFRHNMRSWCRAHLRLLQEMEVPASAAN